MSEDKPVQLLEMRTPLQITNRIAWVLFYLQKATKAINELRGEHLQAKSAYSKAHKQYKFDHKDEGGSQAARDEAAQLANWELFEAQEIAGHALQFAKEKKADLESELSALQTESKLIIKEMELAQKL